MSDKPRLAITPAQTETASASVELVLGGAREVDRHFQVHPLAADDMPLDGLIEARRGDRVVGAILSIAQPGKTGLVWLPRLVEGEPSSTADQLLDAADRQMIRDGLTMAYAILPTVSPDDDRLLRAHDYLPLSGVLYLVADRRIFPPSRPGGPLDFEPYDASNHARLAQVVRATYEQTQDCPRLGDVRDVEDVLDGYRHSDPFDPRHWLIVRHRGEDMGCLIVADHPDHGCCELVYMGLAVSARGHGWGKQLARYAQWLTARAGREQLVIAVDAGNDPAIAVYASVGFHVWDRRAVYVKLLSSTRPIVL
ncbi:MAG TPA: GNAT family N-acetyltransferase [Thermoguttaceae bacterium]|nr:GNAT family N-acetyltransferase [Thermoguttaceae bacterium]